MEKFNKIRRTDKFNRFVEMMNGIEKLQKHQYTGILNEVYNNLKEFAGSELVRAFEYRKKVMVIEDYCDRFFDCKEKGFSYELGCKYQKIDFDFPENIDGEIRWLENLCNVYNPEFKDELLIIRELIIDLGEFKKYFTKYYES